MFNGKELQDELNLDWYDFGARNYDIDLGGNWFTTSAEKWANKIRKRANDKQKDLGEDINNLDNQIENSSGGKKKKTYKKTKQSYFKTSRL